MAAGSGSGAQLSGPTQRTAVLDDDWRWSSRPVLSMVVRVVAVAVPISASVLAAVALGSVWHRPAGTPATLGWWLAISAVATVVLLVVDRVARRLIPLAMLLKLSLVFPDRAPSRFALATRAGTVRNVRAMADAGKADVDAAPIDAAALVLTLLSALTIHDRRTRGHSERVRAFNDLLAEELRLPAADCDRLRWAALLHDVGKLHVPHAILNKPGRPTDEEWATLRDHPIEGAKLLAPLTGWLGPWSAVVVEHHERWDGAGYPYGLAGEAISLGGRIVAVADAYEVMTAARPYGRPVSTEAARRELAACAGTQFDPAVVRAFLNISIGRLRSIIGPLSWLMQLPFLSALPRVNAIAGATGRSALVAAGTAAGVGALVLGGAFGTGTVASSTHGNRQDGAGQSALAPPAGDGATTDSSAVGVDPGASQTVSAPTTAALGTVAAPAVKNAVASPRPAATNSAQALLQAMINDLEARPTGSGSSLVTKLRQAQQASSNAVACGAMAGFDNEVRTQTGKQIPTDRAQQLLAASSQVERQLGC